MNPDDAYETPTDETVTSRSQTEDQMGDQTERQQYEDVLEANVSQDIDEEVIEARQAFDQDEQVKSDEADEADVVVAEEQQLAPQDQQEGDETDRSAELAVPFVGQWNQLISTTNWEKGRIIADWREALITSGVGAQQYSDEAWARRVGGVTAPHVGRLRRVHERFAESYASYQGLYWSHFLAALDWEDAPLWLEGAVQSGWSVSGMREQRWQAHGAVDSQRPTASQIVEVDLDEDVDTGTAPAQGGTREYGDEPATAMGKTYEDADFGDEEEFQSLAGPNDNGASGITAISDPDEPKISPVQPFANLPELPDDLADAIEMMKLAILRHKSAKWEKIDIEIVAKYLEAIGVLMRS